MTQALLEKENTAAYEEDASQFMQEVRGYPLLTPEQELEIAKACAQGDEEAIRTMVNSNLRLVVSVAKEYMGNRPDNWAEEYCQDCGSAMSIVFDNEQITEIIRTLFKKN